MFDKHITNQEINELPLAQFNGGLFVIDTFEKLDYYLPLMQDQKIFGFDTETKPSFKKGVVNPVSLLQLTTSNEAFLIRINKIGLPQEIIDIFNNKEVKKIGLAIKDDIKILQDIHQYDPVNFIDLQDYVKFFNIESQSLRKIAAIVLNIRISKSQQVSNWEKEELSEGQLLYAATDAWACLQIYKTLNQVI
ncbi:MAG: 3'-5' exonuclease [Bacteroidales bacterium]